MNSVFKDQAEMNEQQKVDLIEDNLVDLVYNAAYLEGVRMNFVEARAYIKHDELPASPRPSGLKKLQNLRTAYHRLQDGFLLDMPTDLSTLCVIHRIVNGRGLSDDAGRVRTSVVTITGTEYVPQIPDSFEVNNRIRDIVEAKKTFIERGLDLYCYLMRTQVFLDGNKRCANILTNQFLLRHGQGIFSIRPESNDEFLKLLVEFYETNDPEKLKLFIYNNCFYTDPRLPYVDED